MFPLIGQVVLVFPQFPFPFVSSVYHIGCLFATDVHGEHMSPFSINMSYVFYENYTKPKMAYSTNHLSNARLLE